MSVRPEIPNNFYELIGTTDRNQMPLSEVSVNHDRIRTFDDVSI